MDPTDTAVRTLAALALKEGWGWEAAGRAVEPGVDRVLDPLLDAISADLTEADAKRFSGFVPVVERSTDTPRRALARAKLAIVLCNAMARVRFEQALDASSFRNGEVFCRFPELREHLDDEDLLPYDLFTPLPDALEYGRHALGYSEFTPHFIRRQLSDIASAGKVNLRVRLSADSPVPRERYLQSLEEAVEFGLPFEDELMLRRLWEKHLPTVLRREYPTNEVERAYDQLYPLERLEVLRTERGEHVSFLIEELTPLSDTHIDEGFASTRIFHSDCTVGSSLFSHVDVSHLIYRVETYEMRLRSQMKDKVKAEGHLKLFWLESCRIDRWKALLGATYPRDELVAEYLTGVRSRRPI